MTSQDSSPDILYHYCSSTSFMGIISSKQIWLTDAAQMNDYAEVRWAERTTYNLHIEKAKDGTASSFFKNNYHCRYKAYLDAAPFFIACFSESADALSQWRGYAENGSGYAIGFSVSKMGVPLALPALSFSDRTGRGLNRIIYNPTKQLELIDTILSEDQRKESEDECQYKKLAALAIVMKNEGFHEEREWRIAMRPAIYSQNPNDPDEECLFRSTPKGLSPYFTHDFPADAIAKIICGPTNQTTNKNVALFLEKHGVSRTDTMIERSNISYRG